MSSDASDTSLCTPQEPECPVREHNINVTSLSESLTQLILGRYTLTPSIKSMRFSLFPNYTTTIFFFEAPLPPKLCLLQPIRTQHKINGEYGRVVHFFSLLACIISGVNNFTGRCKEKTNCCGLRTPCIGLRRKLQFEYNYLCGFIFLPIFS